MIRVALLGNTAALGAVSSLPASALAYLGVAPTHWFDFVNNRAIFSGADVGAVTDTPNWSFVRTTTGYAQNAAGLLLPFASGEMRRTDLGLLIENASTNLALRSNDWTNAAWVKSNVTTALTQTGPEGTANAATLLTASAGNGTVLQSITSASANRYGSVWIKRITGSGNIDITLDGGTAWTTISVTSSWTQLGKAQTSVTNPNFGLRIVTNGDAVAVWCGQVESADVPSSPIPTTTASATRNTDAASISSSPGVNYPLTMWAEFSRGPDTGAIEYALQMDDGSANNRVLLAVNNADLATAQEVTGAASQALLTVAGSLTPGTTYKIAARFNTNSVQMARGGTLGTEDTVGTLPATATTIRFGGRETGATKLGGYLKRAAIFNTALIDANLQTITT